MQILINLFLTIYFVYLLYYLLNSIFYYLPSRSKKSSYKTDYPFVSILIPARNEEKNIKRAVDSVLGNDYKNFECVVLDDNSTDRTSEILNSYRDSRLTVIKGKALPEGWIGKNWACHQLSDKSNGEIILFSDADTFHDKRGISELVKKMKYTNADLLSGFPKQIVKTIGEALVVPFIGLFAFGALPHAFFRIKKFNWASCSNGQYQCFKKSAYDDFDGYKKIQHILADDVAFARQMKGEGKKVVYTNCSSQINSRMYIGFRDSFFGFSKSFYPTLNESKILAVLVFIFITLFFLSPYLFILLSNTVNSWACLGVSLLIWFFAMINLRTNPLCVFLHPIVPFVLNSILIHSILSSKKDGYVWKDRVYKQKGEI